MKLINIFKFSFPVAVSLMLLNQSAIASEINIVSDGNTLGSVTSISDASSGVYSGLTFGAVSVGSFGTFTPVPSGAPSGTSVINLGDGSGLSGFFKVTFTLPSDYANPTLTGKANIDDTGSVFLNGNLLTSSIYEFGDNGFSTTSYFKAGLNELVFSDINSGGGPSGAAFYAIVDYQEASTSPVPEPTTMLLFGTGIAGLAGVARRKRS